MPEDCSFESDTEVLFSTPKTVDSAQVQDMPSVDHRDAPSSSPMDVIIRRGSRLSRQHTPSEQSNDSFGMRHLAPIRLVAQRHLVMFAFCLLTATNAFHWVQYTVLDTLITSKLHMSEQLLAFTSTVFMIVYTLGAIPAANLLEKRGLRLTVMLGAVLTLAGALIKCATTQLSTVNAIIGGQTVVAIAQLFVLGLPPNLAAIWYPPEQQNTATAIAVFANSFGVAASFILPPLLITEATFDQDLQRLHCQLALCSAITLLAVILFVRSQPDASEQHELTAHELGTVSIRSTDVKDIRPDSLLQIYRQLFRHRQFLLLFTVYGLSIGVSNAFCTILPRFLARPDLHVPGLQVSRWAGQLGVCYVISGLFGILVVGRLLDRGRRYKLGSIALNVGALLAFAEFAWISTGRWDYWLLFPAAVQMGFCWSAFLMMGFEYAAEITFPLPETISAAILNISTQVFAVLAIELGDLLIDAYNVKASYLALCAVLVGTVVLNLFITDRLPRQAAFQKAKARSSRISNPTIDLGATNESSVIIESD